ncbi:HAD family hydrolase [Beijerinckia mobilis]|uniref:HAD family hydrolase n=1 Tax=Beijerinckia mobilis TaxID=231434 RepID=UPI000554DAA1|nr:HAD family hydrolase [Beijerinckia mobilis]
MANFLQDQVTLVVFDVDGTLIDSMAIGAECYIGAFNDHLPGARARADWENYRHVTDSGVAIELYQRHFGRMPTTQELRSFQDLYVERLKTRLAPPADSLTEISGAAQLLADLRRDSRFAVAIATGAWKVPIHLRLAAAGIDIGNFPFASADDAIERQTIFALAAERAGGVFRRIVLVGDGIWDVATAKSLGWCFVGIGTGPQAASLREAGAMQVVENYLNLTKVVSLLETAAPPQE